MIPVEAELHSYATSTHQEQWENRGRRLKSHFSHEWSYSRWRFKSDQHVNSLIRFQNDVRRRLDLQNVWKLRFYSLKLHIQGPGSLGLHNGCSNQFAHAFHLRVAVSSTFAILVVTTEELHQTEFQLEWRRTFIYYRDLLHNAFESGNAAEIYRFVARIHQTNLRCRMQGIKDRNWKCTLLTNTSDSD